MNELKNRHGENVAWFCYEGAVQLDESRGSDGAISDEIEIYGEDEHGREGCVTVDVCQLLESAHVVITELQKENEALRKQLAEKEAFRLQELERVMGERDAYLKALADISNMCIGDIAMGYRMDAQSIGELICEVTGLNNPALNDATNTQGQSNE